MGGGSRGYCDERSGDADRTYRDTTTNSASDCRTDKVRMECPWPSRKSSLVYVLGLLNIVFAGSLILLMILFLTRGKGSTAATVPPEGGDPAARYSPQ